MENFEFFSDSFGKMSGFLTFLILVLVVLSYVTIKFKETITELIKKSKHNRDINDLIYHSMFLTGDKVLQRIDKIDFTTFDGYDEVKSKLLKKLIHLKIDTVKLRFGEFLKTKDLEKVKQSQLKLMVATTLSNLVNEYNDKAIRVMSEEMNIEIKDAKFLVDKYEEFRQYIVDAFVDELSVIVMDDNYIDNFERLNTILYTVSISLSIIPRDVVETFNNVNGTFKKYNKVA
jgi:hypothetical protein